MRWQYKGLVGLGIAVAVVFAVPALHPQTCSRSPPPGTGPALSDVATWGYQLQHVDPAAIPDDVDLLVTDVSRDGSDLGAWTEADVAALRRRTGGRPRIVLAYLSIGEAESYRGYWRRHWRAAPPRWLGAENKDWNGNYSVQFWDPEWQTLMFDAAPGLLSRTLGYWFPGWRPLPYLDRILASGFDGVYLDRVDGYEQWLDVRPRAADDMIRFVSALADHARQRRPGFLVVPQNAEELLYDASYRAKIDAIAKEDLFFGIDGDGRPNDPAEIASAIAFLSTLQADGKPVLVVEYVSETGAIDNLRLQSRELGFRILFATRELNLPTTPAAPLPIR